MKITQLDYSAIMNANSAQMAAESAAQNNKAIEMSNAINKMNQANFERTAAGRCTGNPGKRKQDCSHCQHHQLRAQCWTGRIRALQLD